LPVIGLVLMLSGLGAAIWFDANVHIRADAEATTLRAAELHLSALRHDRALTDYADAVKTNTRTNLQSSIGTTQDQLALVQASLNKADAGASLEGLGVTALHTCLGGVQNALFSIAIHDNPDAAKAISAVSGPCSSLDGGAAAGLVYPFDFPDPDVVLFGSTYYAYATNSVAGNIQIISSTDRNHWTSLGNALPSLPGWAKANLTWAPSVASTNGTYLMYYTAEFAPNETQCISVATASDPWGPFIDNSVLPLECQQSLGGSIDPSAFTDANGVPYLVWKSGAPGSSKIWAQQLDAAGTGFAAGTKPTQLLAPDQPWEAGTVEAPDLVLVNGHYYLFFSGNDWNSANYAVGVADCAGPLGPCTDASPNPILSSDTKIAGPGGESFLVDAKGNFWIAFHAWIPGAIGFPNSRDLYVRPLNMSGAVPSVSPPGSG
jgi:hypothetical protein